MPLRFSDCLVISNGNPIWQGERKLEIFSFTMWALNLLFFWAQLHRLVAGSAQEQRWWEGLAVPHPLQATSSGGRDQVAFCMVSIFLLGDPGLRRLLRVTRHGVCREAGALERG